MIQDSGLSPTALSIGAGKSVVATSRALVLGGGTAGLLAALVLARHVGHVTVVDSQEGNPRADGPRLLGVRDQQLLDTLVPGLCQALRDAGAVSLNLGQHIEWFLLDRWRPHYQSALEGLCCSVALLDAALQQRLQSETRVSFQGVRAVEGLLWDEQEQRIAGVRASLGTERATEFPAELVVDATGPMSKSSDWLNGLGYARPAETVFPTGLNRATRLYHWPQGACESWRALVIQSARGAQPRGAVALTLEGERLHVTMVGVPDDWSPSDTTWLDFAATLPSPRLADCLRAARPLTPVAVSPTRHHYRQHYERLAPAPDGLLAFGGTAVQPPAIQDDTLALDVLSGAVLEHCLNTPGPRGLATRFHRQLAMEMTERLQVQLQEGLQWARPTPPAPLEPGQDLMARYMEQVRAATLVSTAVLETWHRVQQGVDPPHCLFQPDIVLQVLENRRGAVLS